MDTNILELQKSFMNKLKLLFLFSIITVCIGIPIAAAEKVYTLDRPLKHVVEAAKELFHEDNITSSFNLKQIINTVESLDLRFTAELRPKHKYYRFSVELLQSVDKINYVGKTLELWGTPNGVICKSTLYISYGRDHHFPLRFIDRIKNNIISEIEQGILDTEHHILTGN